MVVYVSIDTDIDVFAPKTRTRLNYLNYTGTSKAYQWAKRLH